MLHDYLIYNPTGADWRIKEARTSFWPNWLRPPRMVMPRELCYYQHISCRGIPLYKLREFARLQIQLHSPFVTYGSSAVKQGPVMHLWIWDSQHEAQFAEKHPKYKPHAPLVQSLFSTPREQNVVWLQPQVSSGFEAQLWHNKKLQDSIFFANLPTQQQWQDRLEQDSQLKTLGWPHLLPPPKFSALARWPWGFNLATRPQKLRRLAVAKLVTPLLISLSIAIASWAAWLQGQTVAYQKLISASNSQLEEKIAQDQPQQKARARTQLLLLQTQAIRSLSSTGSTLAALDETAKLLERQGMWLRDIEINGLSIEATLVAPGGSSPRLTAILAAIENNPLFYNAQFVDVTSGAGFRFTWRIDRKNEILNRANKQ
jgi:hypothetical protein